MTTVICTITVLAFHFFSKTEVKGIVLKQNESKYLVDFSKEAKEKGYEGDYSSRLVDKKDCI